MSPITDLLPDRPTESLRPRLRRDRHDPTGRTSQIHRNPRTTQRDPRLAVPLGALDRAVWIDRLGRQLARLEQTTQVRIARDLLARCRTLTRSIVELDRE